MDDDPTGDYKGHVIAAKAPPALDQKFYSVFKVHTATRTKHSVQFHRVHEEKESDDFIFDSAADALDDARARAKKWIDAQAD